MKSFKLLVLALLAPLLFASCGTAGGKLRLPTLITVHVSDDVPMSGYGHRGGHYAGHGGHVQFDPRQGRPDYRMYQSRYNQYGDRMGSHSAPSQPNFVGWEQWSRQNGGHYGANAWQR